MSCSNSSNSSITELVEAALESSRIPHHIEIFPIILKISQAKYDIVIIVFSLIIVVVVRRVATCKPGKPGLNCFSETLALFFSQFLSFRKMKVQDKQNGPSGLPEKTGWLRAWLLLLFFN